MDNLDAGKLRHRITLKRNTNTSPNSVGQVKPSYTTVGTYYAFVECMGGDETVNASQLKGVLHYEVTVRASSGPVYPSDQIVWGTHTMNVVSATPDPYEISILVKATEKGQQ